MTGIQKVFAGNMEVSKTNISEWEVPALAALGNPILDMYVIVEDREVLDTFNLEPDGQKEIDRQEFIKILDYFNRRNIIMKYSPGGVSQNTVRIIQGLVNIPSFCVFFGGCGNDEEGRLLESKVKDSGVNVRYTKQDCPTASCISMINGDSRSLVCCLDAANVYTVSDFLTEDNVKLFDHVKIVYIEGFFISHSFDVAIEVVKLCHKNGIAILFNLCGVYLCELCPVQLVTMAAVADILVGNNKEFKGIGRILYSDNRILEDVLYSVQSTDYLQYFGSVQELGIKNSLKLSRMAKLGKTVVCTQGGSPVLVVCGDGKLVTVTVPPLDPVFIKDTTGAGDAFLAGFVTAFLQDEELSKCIDSGISTAHQAIQHIGIH